MDRNIPASRILGTGHYLPSQVLTNDDLARRVDTSDEWIRSRTGIGQRHIAAPEEASSDMAAAASRLALEAAGLSPNDLDAIIVGTISPDKRMPACAVYLQQKLGVTNNCPSFDLSAACAGFIYGLGVADAFIRASQSRYVLVVGVELLSRVIDWQDRATCVLFGDGAGAAVLGPSDGDGRGIVSTHLYSDGSKANDLHIPGGGTLMPFSAEVLERREYYVRMNGQEVFKYAVRAISRAAGTAIESNGLTPNDIDWVMPHQANKRILDGVRQRCGVPKERFFINIEETANTSSASVPIVLDQAVRSGHVRRGQNLVFCALGGGFSWGSALVRW
ncbi:MAG: ketoacyl-ACP synthase III [Myxococcales bacterium]|nr:ketoacyl-ACP synthase III [Myxococcales bacterium]